MKNFYIRNQLSIIRDRNNPKLFNEPTMPLIIVFEDGHIVQAISIRAAVSIIAGYDYFDAKDASEEWNFRLAAAKKQTLAALEKGIRANVYDPFHGQLLNNLTIDQDESNSDLMSCKNIYVQNDRLFILSLINLGAITVYEREDSFQLKEHDNWKKLKNGEVRQSCSWCLHSIKESKCEKSDYFCPIYNLPVAADDGSNCCSFAFSVNNAELVYPSCNYHNISHLYDINKLLDSVGQTWIVPDIIF